MAITLLAAFATNFVIPAFASAGNNHKTVSVDCRKISVALATLDIAGSIADKNSLDPTLQEAEIAPNYHTENNLLKSLTNQVKDACPQFSNILNGLKFEGP